MVGSLLMSEPLVAIGPLRLARNGEISILGHDLDLDSATAFFDVSHSRIDNLASDAIVVAGSYVAVTGSMAESGEVSPYSVVRLSTSYVAGSDLAYLRSPITALNANTARFQVGDMTVDFAQAMHDTSATAISRGSVAEFSGYTSGHNQFIALNARQLQGIHGSGLRGIHGSGLRGIHGSGLRGIHGSGLR